MEMRQRRWKLVMDLEQPSPSLVSSPSLAHDLTAPHRLIGPVVLLKDILHSVLTAVREHHDHLVAVGTCDVGLRGREMVLEAGPRASCARLDAARRAGHNPSLFLACFSGVRVVRVNRQEEGHCLLGNDVVIIAAQHLIAPFIFILSLARCLAPSPSAQPS